ncbi:MAG: rubrerythrin family protein [Ruminococcus sp.]|nr:rubrerythrin family protein [Ruminococcus sp.]
MAVDFSKSETKINLMRAFAGESQARNRYTFAADKAKKMGCGFIYNIFNITANQEKAHAEVFYNHLKQENGGTVFIDNAGYPVDNFDKIEDLLRSAQHNEYEEFEKVYPAFAATAKEEGFPDIAFSFEKIALIESAHGDRFGCFAELLEKSKMFEGDEDTQWMCLNCGHIHTGKSVPKSCPVCQYDQGYFVPYKYYKFIAEKYGCAALCQ